MALNRKTPKTDHILKEIRPVSKKGDYRPENLGSNKMKVTQLAVCRLPRLVFGSPSNVSSVQCSVSRSKLGTENRKPETGFGGENFEKNERRYRPAEQEAKSVEIEVAACCLFGSRLNADPRQRMRKRESHKTRNRGRRKTRKEAGEKKGGSDKNSDQKASEQGD